MRFFRMWIPAIALFAVAAFGLTGCGGGGGGGASAPTPTPGASAPSAPTGVVATANSSSQINITWPSVTGATSYNVYYSATSGVTKANGTQIVGAASPCPTTGLLSGTSYFYVVTAVNDTGESVESAQATAKTPVVNFAPTGVSATPGNGQASIAWAPVAGATSYNVYSTTDSTVTATNGLVPVNATSPSVQSGLSNGTAYYFLVTAVVNGVESAPTLVNATPAANPVPANPVGVTATTLNFSSFGGSNIPQITVAWTAVPGATSYNVYRSIFPGVTTSNTKANSVAVTGTSFSENSPNASSAFYYVVTAVGTYGESALSAEVVALPVLFSNEMVSGKTVTYTEDSSEGSDALTFVCAASGTVSYSGTLGGKASSGVGTWDTDGGAFTITIPTGSLTFFYDMFSISGPKLLVNLSGTPVTQQGTMAIN